jgi:hypothetical protein
MDVKQPRQSRERRPDGRDDRGIAPLGDVRHGREPDPYPTTRCRARRR